MNKKELRKLKKEDRAFAKELKVMIKEKKEHLKLCACPFSRTEAVSMYKEITAENNQRLYEKRYAKNLCKQVVHYASGKYTVYSVYDTIQNRYSTQITYTSETNYNRYVNRQMHNKQIQQLLHEHGQRIKQ